MKCALAALALASILISPAWAQNQTRTEIADGDPAVQFAAPGKVCRSESVDPACASEGLFPSAYDIRREFDGYYFERNSGR